MVDLRCGEAVLQVRIYTEVMLFLSAEQCRRRQIKKQYIIFKSYLWMLIYNILLINLNEDTDM